MLDWAEYRLIDGLRVNVNSGAKIGTKSQDIKYI